MNERPIPDPPMSADPGHEDEVELTRLGAVVEDVADDDVVTIIDRADRLEAEQRRLPVHGDEDAAQQ